MREPAFWWREGSLASALLAPVATVYGAIATWRLARPGRRPGIPVVCIGNLTVGGAGNPPKFFATLAEAGVAVAATRSFADHHRYTGREAAALCEEAERDGLALLTTEKDLARLSGEEQPLSARARALR